VSDDTEWPNNVAASPGAKTVAIGDPTGRSLAIVSRTRVQSPGPGLELHFLRETRREPWEAQVEKLRRSGAYSWVRLVSLAFHDPETGEPVTLDD
jgi:hypothetical protein